MWVGEGNGKQSLDMGVSVIATRGRVAVGGGFMMILIVDMTTSRLKKERECPSVNCGNNECPELRRGGREASVNNTNGLS